MKKLAVLLLLVGVSAGTNVWNLQEVFRTVFSKLDETSKLISDAVQYVTGIIPRLLTNPNRFFDFVTDGFCLRIAPGFQWSNKERIKDIYDFIIVGSSAAGSLLARRLAENSEHLILLLEIGKEEGELNGVPVLTGVNQMSSYNWQTFMEPQPNFGLGIDQNILPWNRGRALGGTSVINSMVYSRGNPAEYDKWAEAGNEGWSFKDVLPYFLKTERARNLADSDLEYHNFFGLWNVENSFQSPILDTFLEAGKELGYKVTDYNGKKQIGFAPVQGTTTNGRRRSAGKAFLENVKDKPNLHIHTNVLVTKVLISNKAAYGVRYIQNGVVREVLAGKEVILSAGPSGSAQLLMLSGIGPEHRLQDLGIPSVVDLPVGRNLQDHLAYVGLDFQIEEDVGVSMGTCLNPGNLLKWLAQGTGPVSSLGGVGGLAYIKTHVDKNRNKNLPDIQLVFSDASLSSDYGIRAKSFRIKDDYYQRYWAPNHNDHTVSIYPVLVRPKSVGELTLRSNNAADQPRYYPNYLNDPDGSDLKTMIAGIRFVLKLAKKMSSNKNVTARLISKEVPGCGHLRTNSDEYWECAIRTFSVSWSEQVGTCSMGSVVDNELKVIGTQFLRVVDTSVVPFALSGSYNAISAMIGEKAADLVKLSWIDDDIHTRDNATSTGNV